MRISIIGNMNNNGFSLLRYFCDLGADPYLYCFANDGTGGLSHFNIEADSWNPEAWRHRIRRIPVCNSAKAVYPWPLGSRRGILNQVVAEIQHGGARTIGTGIAPAMFFRVNRSLDIFYPYSVGVEFIEEAAFLHRLENGRLRRPFYRHVQQLQEAGIGNAKYCLNAEMGHTKSAFDRMGRPFERISIPMFYNRESPAAVQLSRDVRILADRIEQSEFAVFCHARHLWVGDGTIEASKFSQHSKNTDWLIRGYKDFTQAAPDSKLFLVEYGPDVEFSKRLIEEMDLARNVVWFPKMPRKEISYLIRRADACVGEFYTEPGTIWGGTGWEVLANGKPLLQSFNFQHDEYQKEFGHEPPPIFDVRSPQDVTLHLMRLFQDPGLRENAGESGRVWFDQNNGISLASKWLELLS